MPDIEQQIEQAIEETVVPEEQVPEEQDTSALAKLDSADAAFTYLISEAQKQADNQLQQMYANAEEPEDKEKIKFQAEKTRWELQQTKIRGASHLAEMKRVYEESGVPLEILALVPVGDSVTLKKTAELWKKQKGETVAKKPIEKVKEEVPAEKSVEKPVEKIEKKLDSGVSGSSSGNQDWRNLPPSQQIALGLSRRKGS